MSLYFSRNAKFSSLCTGFQQASRDEGKIETGSVRYDSEVRCKFSSKNWFAMLNLSPGPQRSRNPNSSKDNVISSPLSRFVAIVSNSHVVAYNSSSPLVATCPKPPCCPKNSFTLSLNISRTNPTPSSMNYPASITITQRGEFAPSLWSTAGCAELAYHFFSPTCGLNATQESNASEISALQALSLRCL